MFLRILFINEKIKRENIMKVKIKTKKNLKEIEENLKEIKKMERS